MLQKSQDRHKISFAFEFNNKNIKKVFGANPPPPPPPDKLDLPPDIIRVKRKLRHKRSDSKWNFNLGSFVYTSSKKKIHFFSILT